MCLRNVLHILQFFSFACFKAATVKLLMTMPPKLCPTSTNLLSLWHHHLPPLHLLEKQTNRALCQNVILMWIQSQRNFSWKLKVVAKQCNSRNMVEPPVVTSAYLGNLNKQRSLSDVIVVWVWFWNFWKYLWKLMCRYSLLYQISYGLAWQLQSIWSNLLKRMDLWEETQWEPRYSWMSSLMRLEPKVSTFCTSSHFPQLLAMES